MMERGRRLDSSDWVTESQIASIMVVVADEGQIDAARVMVTHNGFERERVEELLGIMVERSFITPVPGTNGAYMAAADLGPLDHTRFFEAPESVSELDAVADIDGVEVLTRVASYAAAMFTTRWAARRWARKKGAPEWSVDLYGRLTTLVAAQSFRQNSKLDDQGAKEVGKYLGTRINALLEKAR